MHTLKTATPPTPPSVPHEPPNEARPPRVPFPFSGVCVYVCRQPQSLMQSLPSPPQHTCNI